MDNELHLLENVFDDDPPVLICPACNKVIVITTPVEGQEPRPVRCTCGAVPCAGCARQLGSGYRVRILDA